jgi:hypothetical protein
VEWGGQVILEPASAQRFTFALATSLSAVCQSLNVELVLRHNTGVNPYWGQVGHYSIAAFACEALAPGKLKTLMAENLSNISFSIAELTPEEITQRLKDAKANDGFVPLADVPDIVRKQHESRVKGGRDDRWAGKGRSTGPEHPTHYADIDVPRNSDGKTLLQLCLEDPANISVAVWQQFYTAQGSNEQRERGLLPFRVWQFYDALVELARAGDTAGFVAAAGLLAHYTGDACQPLHGSMYADGYADQKVTIVHHRRGTGEEYEEESHADRRSAKPMPRPARAVGAQVREAGLELKLAGC